MMSVEQESIINTGVDHPCNPGWEPQQSVATANEDPANPPDPANSEITEPEQSD